MDLSTQNRLNYLCYDKICEFLKIEFEKNPETLKEFFDIEKLQNTFEFIEYYKELLENYHKNPSKENSQRFEKAYQYGKTGKFNSSEIYSYGEIKKLAKNYLFNNLSACSQNPCIT